MELVSLGLVPASSSPLPVASLLWQPRPGAWMFTFACKATFTLQPIQSPLAPEQQPINEADRHWSDDPSWSLYAPTDLVPIRPRADVVLVGEAYAPGGQPVRSLVARLLIGEIDKSIEVYSERWFTQDNVLHEGDRFARMPLLWERAAGGPDTSNPVGVRADARDAYGRHALPNLQPPGTLVATAGDAIEPIGFGPLDPAWPARRQRLGRHAAAWSDTEWTRQALPTDLDATYFNAAPRDQQTAHLRDDERLVLDNLHVEHPHLVTNLSGHHPRAFLARPGKLPQPLQIRADLLWIDTLRGLCTLTWRGQVPLEQPDEAGQVLIALEEPGQTLTWSDLERLAADRASIEPGPNSEDAIRTLPPRGAADPATAELSEADLEEEEAERLVVGTAIAPMQPINAPVLPFAGAPPAPPPPARADSAQRLAGTPFAAAPPSAQAIPPAVSPAPAIAPAIAPAPPPLVPSPPAFVAPPPVASPPPVAPPLVRAPAPRTIGEAAIEAAAPMAAAAAPGIAAGAVGASDAAAAASAPFALPREGASPARAAAPSEARQASQLSALDREILDLLWFDKDSVPRFRRHAPWRAILKELQSKPPDPELDDPSLGDDPMSIEDRREVFELLARASATDHPGLIESLESGERDDGKFVPPLRLFAGELHFPFDELETLKRRRSPW